MIPLLGAKSTPFESFWRNIYMFVWNPDVRNVSTKRAILTLFFYVESILFCVDV